MSPNQNDYTRRSRSLTHAEWLNLSAEWRREGGTLLPRATVSREGRVQCHIVDHGSRIHAISTLSDVPAIAERQVHPHDC